MPADPGSPVLLCRIARQLTRARHVQGVPRLSVAVELVGGSGHPYRSWPSSAAHSVARAQHQRVLSSVTHPGFEQSAPARSTLRDRPRVPPYRAERMLDGYRGAAESPGHDDALQ